MALSYDWNAKHLYVVDVASGCISTCHVKSLLCTVVVEGLETRRVTDVLVDTTKM